MAQLGIDTGIANPLGGGNLTVSNSLFSGAATAVSDIFASQEDQAKAAAAQTSAAAAETTAQADILAGTGDALEAGAYGQAATLAELNAQYTKASTAIQVAQGQRQIYQTIGGEKVAAAGSGLAGGGTVADILRNSAQQGALNQAITKSQGQIQVAGYQEQAQSYTAMQNAALLSSEEQNLAAQGEQDVAQGYLDTASAYQTAAKGSDVGAIISGLGAVASLFAAA
jgi:hypothetical protein